MHSQQWLYILQKACSRGAIEENVLNNTACNNCGNCVSVCPSGALNIYGKEVSVDDILDEVEKESSFYQWGDGGITLSGGEPFAQGEFALALLMESKKRHIHTAVETCGFCEKDVLRAAANYIDYIMFDIKCMDSDKHQKYTGHPNERILDNLNMLFDEFPKLHKHIRTPVIPTFNDSEKDIKEIQNFLKGRENYSYELLLYHRFGQDKYKLLGKDYPDFPRELDKEKFRKLKSLLDVRRNNELEL